MSAMYFLQIAGLHPSGLGRTGQDSSPFYGTGEQ
jgi:hypothetical protein